MADKKRETPTIHFDFKDAKGLQRYVNQFGQIESRRRTGFTG